MWKREDIPRSESVSKGRQCIEWQMSWKILGEINEKVAKAGSE